MKYDVVIAGGGTSGCAAAYMLGLFNKKVLLIEKNSFLGGTMTSSLVTPMMKTAKSSINNEFFDTFYKYMSKYNAAITYSDGNSGWFNPVVAKVILDKMLNDVNVDIIFNSSVNDIDISNSNIVKLYFNDNLLSEPIETKYVIDATGNSDIAFLANCEFIDKTDEKQPTTLRFIMGGVDLDIFGRWLLDYDTDRNVTSLTKLNNKIHLSTAYTWDSNKHWALAPLFDDAVKKGILKDEDRNYFQLFTVPDMQGSVAFNCPRIYFDSEINPLNPKDVSCALRRGREAILRLVEFCRIYFPGFENSYLSSIADSLGVRVSRRIKGKYIYTIDDLKSSKKFNNPVVISDYPVDVHSNKKNDSVLEHASVEYQLPIESLMSADIDNLFVIGRCLSADFYAQAALRIIPSCFSMGVGVAKYINSRT